MSHANGRTPNGVRTKRPKNNAQTVECVRSTHYVRLRACASKVSPTITVAIAATTAANIIVLVVSPVSWAKGEEATTTQSFAAQKCVAHFHGEGGHEPPPPPNSMNCLLSDRVPQVTQSDNRYAAGSES